MAGEGSSFHVFVRENSEWQHQKMQRDNSGNNFSNDVSLSADGNLLAVGSPPNRSDVPNNTLGAVFVYERLDGVWQQQAFLQSSNPADSNNGVVISTGDRFGQAVSLSADGSTIAVGAPSEKSSAIGINGDQNDNSLSNSGAAYVFTRVDGSWQQKAYVKSANSHRSQDFGSAINLDADGDSLAIGARGEHSNANGINGDRNGSDNPDSGAVFLY